MKRWPRETLRDASFIGCLKFAVVASFILMILTTCAMFLIVVPNVSRLWFVVAKTIYGGMCGLIVTPIIAVAMLNRE